MKAIIPTLVIACCTLFSNETASVLPSDTKVQSIIKTSIEDASLNKSGLEFTVHSSNINTKYSEFSSGIFRGKLIMVSSKKIGGFGNGVDRNTNEPFTELFCLDIDKEGEISNPLLFSRILKPGFEANEFAFEANKLNFKTYKQVLKLTARGNSLVKK